MRKIGVFILYLTIFTAGFTACAREAWAVDPVEVFIDGRDPAFLVFQGIAPNAPAQARQEMTGYATLQNIDLVSWATFRTEIKSILAPHIIKNEYPASNMALIMVTLVKAFPGKPFALTWNGGLAVGFFDYQLAVTTFKSFQADPAQYEASRTPLSQAPLNPDAQLSKVLAK